MITKLKTKTGFKAMALAVAFSFLYQQILWAGDLAVTTLENLNQEQSQTFAPDYLRSQQTANQSVIAQKQDIEDIINLQNQTANNISSATEESSDISLELQGPKSASSASAAAAPASSILEGSVNTPEDNGAVLSVTTGDGDVVHYAGGAISSIEKKDGTVLKEIVIGESGELIAAEIIYIDGTIQVVNNGKVIKITKPDGTILNYNDDETLASIQYPGDKTVTFSYIKDAQGAVIETILTDPEKIAYYGNDNKLKRVEFNTGRKIEYESGIISKITEADSSSFLFDIKTNADGTFTSTIAQYTSPDGAIYKYTVDETGALGAITVEKDGVIAVYDKDGNLTSITKDGQAITPEIVTQAQADYDAAFLIYKEKEGISGSYQSALDDATKYLDDAKTALKLAEESLSSAIQSLNAAIEEQKLRQSDYDAADKEYNEAKAIYDADNDALNTAISLETEASQALLAAQGILTDKEKVLNEKTAFRQALETTITDLTAKIQSDQVSLVKAKESLAKASKEETTALAAYNSVLSATNAKEAVYNNAVKARQVKEAVFKSAAAKLKEAQLSKSAAEQKLSEGNPYIVSSYANYTGSTILNQYKNFITDEFNRYNSSIWYKPADSLVTMTGGSASLKGTGKDYSAAFYTRQSYDRADKPVLSTTFKVSSASGGFTAAIDGYTSSKSLRRVGIYVYSGKIYLQTAIGSVVTNDAILVSNAKVNTFYNLEFEVTPQNIKVYLWESTAKKPTYASYTYIASDWTAVRPFFSLYSGTAAVDKVTMKCPAFNSTYNSASQLVKDEYQDGRASIYSYSNSNITISDYKKYLTSPYNLSTGGLWYKSVSSLVTMSGGSATLKGTGKDYNAALSTTQSFDMSNDVVMRSNFKIDSKTSNFMVYLDSYNSTRVYKRIGVLVKDGKIYIQNVERYTESLPQILVPNVKVNTNYTVEFQATSTAIKIFFWESSTARPTSPSYTYTVRNWTATTSLHYVAYSGTATVSNVSIGYIPTTRTIASSSAEYKQILARNQLVKNLNSAIANVNTAQNAYNTANTNLSNAKTAESKACGDLTTARNTLAARKKVLDSKTAAKKTIQSTIAKLNTSIAAYKSQLSKAQQNLKTALSGESTARSAYNNAASSVNTKKTAYDNAVRERKAKEAAYKASAANLDIRTAARNEVDKVLKAAIQTLANAQAVKDTTQAVYDLACKTYSSAQTAHDQALTDFNNAKVEEGTAKTLADSLLEALNRLLSVTSAFSKENTVLQDANSKLEAVSILYDAERCLKEVHKINGDIQSYADGLLGSIVSGSETTLYSYDLSALGNIDGITVDRDGIKRIYDKYGNIQSLSLDDTTKIVYENGKVKEIQKSDGTTLKNMTFRDSGELDEALVSYPDGSMAVYDDAKLLQAISASGDITDYQDGKIRRITLEDKTVYDWSYDGDNIIILDNAKNEKRTYLEGKLIALEELAGSGLTTKYHYDETSGDLSKSEICKDGEILYTYTYTYEDGLTLVHDEDGNTQAYTKEKKLSYIIDSKGRKYSYTYVGKNEGYVDVYFPSGNKAKYDLNGNVIEITKSDGTVIKDITFDVNKAPQDFTYIKDGATYKVEDGKIGEVLSKDGVKTVYYDNGFVKSVGTEAVDLTEYQYFVKDSKAFNSPSSLLTGSFNQTSLFNSNATTYITLSQDPLRFGTGTDGAKHVTANETLEAGTYNFESLTIDPGKTLTIAPGAVIKTLGTITVDGAIFCGGTLDISAHDFIVSASGSVTGAVNIKCDTISNAGIITGNVCLTGAGSSSAATDDNFSNSISGSHGASGSIAVTFPSCDISKARYRISLANYGLPASGSVYLRVNGNWVCIASYAGSGDSGEVDNTTGWSNVTGMMMTGQSQNGNCVCSCYSLHEMQAIIGQSTIEYTSGNPGTVNTTASRPIASKEAPNNPLSGSYESGVIELNAIKLDSISWSQELPEGTNITFQTRTGNALTPDSTWSEWSAELTSPISSQITSPEGKYIQYKVNLSATDPAVTPLLKLEENSPITFGYSRAPSGSSELSDIYYATVSKDGITSTCDKNSLPSLIFDPDYLDAVTSEIPGYLLNDTQKVLYLKDSVIISELTAIKSIDGTTTEYCQGQISKITRADGTVIKSASFDADNNAEDFTYSKDGATYIVKDGKIDTVVTASGESIKYYSYGLIESVETGSSKKEYEYGIQTGENYTTRSIFRNGSFTNASILGQDSTTYLQLSKSPLRFGTGSDGVKHVTADETLEAGTYNFESLTIDPGKTLIAGPNTVIKVLDTVTVNGAIFCGGSMDIYAPEFNVSASGSVTGAVNIKCDSISNAGIITGNVCLTGTGGLSATTDDNFGTNISGSHGASGGAVVTFPSCDISKARYRVSLANYGLPASGSVYLRVNGNWVCIASYAGSGDSGEVDNTTGWSNVTGMMMTGQSQNGNCVCSCYSLHEMQAIIGQSTIEYTSGNPGTVNTTPSRPTVSIKATDNPSSGSFESEVMELNAIKLDSISWNQELPEGTNITFQTRTGDTAAPDATWSEWSESLTNSAGSDITSAGKKYFQYRVNLSTSDNSVTPKLILDSTHGISISYIKVSDNPLDPYVKVKENNATSAYNRSGTLIWTEDSAGLKTNYDPANPAGAIDPAALKFDPSYTNSIARDLPSSKLSDAQKVITVYDQGNDTPVEIITAGQSITYFDEGFATKVVDKNGVTQVVYTYDEDKNITKVEFLDARQKLEENYQKALAEIATQKEAALAKLAKAEANARADIIAKSADIQKQIDNERLRLEHERAKYDSNVYDLSEFDRAFREIDDYETRLRQQVQDAYTDLNNQLTAARARIESDASTAMQDLIDNDYNKILGDIVQKESSPLVYQYYRKVLGRDPGDDDLLYWANIAKTGLRPLTATEITQYLKNLTEYTDRGTRKQNIITSLTDFFAQYLSASDADKEATLTSLGISSAEAVTLTQDDVNAMISWLSGQSLHFGDSAFETIIALLKNNGINRSFEDIGKDALKVDILTGVITKNTEGDLLISMYAMRKAAEASGLTLSSQKITYDDLKDQVSRNNVIVHIDGKHYVQVTSIDEEDGTITYIDPTVGHNGQAMTLSRAEFMEKWRGYSLSKELSYNKDLPDSPSKQINVTQEKNIRGSGWWSDFWRGIVNFFQKIVSPIATILTFVPGLQPIGLALHGLNIIIQTISFVVKTGTLMDIVWASVNAIGSCIGSMVMPGIYNAVGSVTNNIFGSIGNMFTTAAKGMFSGVIDMFNTFSLAVKDIATGIGHIVSLGTASAEIATSIGYNIITQGISLGTDFLFKSMNIDPSFAHIGSALLTGAVMGSVNPSTTIVSEALKYGTIAGVEEVGKATDLDPNITHLSAMLAGSLVGGVLDIGGQHLTYEELMKSITLNILSESAYIGVTEIGSLLGIDPRISYLAGVGIGASIPSFFKNENPWNSIVAGLERGITGLAMDYASQKLGLSPLISTFAFRAITGAIEGALEYGDIFKGVTEAAVNSTGKYLCLGGQGNDPWSQAVYISRVLDFTRTVSDAPDTTQGLIDALTKYAITIYSQETMNSIWAQGGIADMVTGRAIVVPDDLGRTVKRIYVDDTKKEYIDIDAATNILCGKRFIQKDDNGNKEITITELYNVDILGNQVLSERHVSEKAIDGSLSKFVFDGKGNLISSMQFNATGQKIQKITPVQGTTHIDLNTEGSLENGQIEYEEAGIKLIYQDGEMINAGLLEGTLTSGGTSNLAYALDTYDNPLFDISSYDREAAKQDFGLFAHEVIREWKTKLGLSDEIADRVEEKLTTSGYNIIDNPQLYDAMKNGVEEVSAMPGISISCAADLGTVIQQKAQEWGVNLSLQGGNTNTGLGFLIYFAGDFLGDTLKIGQGTAEAMTLFETGHPIKGTLSILGDLGRATTFTQGLQLISKALSVTGGVAGTITNGSTNALRNIFRVGRKVLGFGDEVVEISVASSSTTAPFKINYNFPSELAHSTSDLRSLMRGIDKARLSANSRFGPAVYLAEDSGTALLEVGAKSGVEAVVSYGLDATKVRLLDLTNPIIANAYGYSSSLDRVLTQSISRQILNQGYNVIKYESTKSPGKFCYAVLDEFNDVLKANF